MCFVSNFLHISIYLHQSYYHNEIDEHYFEETNIDFATISYLCTRKEKQSGL